MNEAQPGAQTAYSEAQGRSRGRARQLAPFAVVAVLALPALQPLLTDQFTCGYDNSFHLWRAVEVHHLLGQGVLYPRWAADMAHGYGFLLFNFVSPLSAYVAAILRFVGLSWVRAVNGTFVLGLLLSGLTMFLFVREHFGRRAGLVAAVAYVYAPFQAYDAFNRGGMSQAFAWWLPPLVLWSLGRWHNRRGGAATLLVGALSTAALILTHNVFAFLFGPLMAGLLLLPLSDGEEKGWRTRAADLARGALPLVLGLGLTTFFWLPGLAERDWVQTERLLGVWVFDYRNNFLSLKDLLALPRVTDPALINDWPPRAVGLVPVLVALLPLLGWRRLSQWQRRLAALTLGGLVVFGVMTLPASRPLWDHLPLLPYVQFPWRFLGPAAFCAAVLAGAGVRAMSDTDKAYRATLAGAILIPLIFVANLGWFFPDHCAPPGDITVSGMIRWEQATDTLGATAGGEYLPEWVKRMPSHPQLLEDYASGGPVRRLDTDSLPSGAQVVRADYGPLGAEIELNTPEAFQAQYLAFYYPGWKASIDDRTVEVRPSDPHGLITFDVPPGRHVIRLRFGATGLRRVALWLSAVSLVALALTAWFLRRRTSPMVQRAGRSRDLVAFAILACGLIATRFASVEGYNPLRQSRLSDGRLLGIARPYDVDFGHRWVLLGHERLPERIASGDALQTVLYWRALDAQGRDYAASLALVDASGQHWTEVGMRSPRWHRTPPPVYTWPGDGYGLTAYLADTLPGTPPGAYRLVLTAFDKADPQTPLTAHASDGVALGPSLDLGELYVERATSAPDPGEVSMQTRLDIPLGALTLAGVSLDRAEAAPGDPVRVTLFWEVGGESQGQVESGGLPDLMAHLSLIDGSGAEVMAWELPPVRDDWPTSAWKPDVFWRGQHLIRLPAGLESGIYEWQLQLYESAHPASRLPEPAVELGGLRVNAPARLWSAPPLQLSLAADLDRSVRLLGANVQPTDAISAALQAPQTLTVTLAWEAQAEMAISYRVFLHLLTPEGELLTQSDGEPAAWTRPTSGWAPGEVVLDARVLDIPAGAPAGTYTLVAGIYDPDSKERLALPDGTTTVLITPITLKAP